MKIGDRVYCDGGYSFDPCVGVIVDSVFAPHGYSVRVENRRRKGDYWWFYFVETMQLLSDAFPWRIIDPDTGEAAMMFRTREEARQVVRESGVGRVVRV